MSKNYRQLWSLCLLGFSVALGSCQENLHITDKTFACSSNADCLPGFVCEGEPGFSTTICRRPIETDVIEEDISDTSQEDTRPISPCELVTCTQPEVCCEVEGEGRCVNLETDPTHCGACGAACGLYERCEASLCACGDRTASPGRPVCGTSSACCENACSVPDLPSCACNGQTCPPP